MRRHGLEEIVYPVDENLQPIDKDFIQLLRDVQPQVVVLFHPVGISNTLLDRPQAWLHHLPITCLLIEDCAHRVVESRDIHFLTDRHFLIDSWRKVMPLQGACLYSQSEIPHIPLQNIIYFSRILLWWSVMQVFLNLAHFAPSIFVAKKANWLADKAMERGYEIIGDSYRATPVPRQMVRKRLCLNSVVIAQTKIAQANLYAARLRSLPSDLRIVNFLPRDRRNLRGFPIRITGQAIGQVERLIKDGDLPVCFGLDDSPWSKTQKVIYLPMGLHVMNNDIHSICSTLRSLT
jgi:hypothetical protein